MMLANVKFLCAAPATLLSLSLMGCASNCPTPPADSLMLPAAPSESTPQPQVSYSLSAAEAIKTWREKQMGTRLMQQPAARPGQ